MRQEQLDRLTHELIARYEELPTLPDQGEPLPSFEAMVELVDDIKRLLFPGFYANEQLTLSARPHRVGYWLSRLHQRLAQLLRLALKHERSRVGEGLDCCEQDAASLSERLLNRLPDLRSALILDAQAALEGDPAAHNLEEVILTYPGFEATLIHRFAHELYLARVPYLPRALAEYAHAQTGIDIHPGARIGASFFIDHGTGVVIGETTLIGDRVKIYQGVTLGALSVKRSLSGQKRHPTIEDDVIIYAGATVLGGETTIGRASMVGGNVWLTRSIPAQTSVIVTPPSLELKSSKPRDHD